MANLTEKTYQFIDLPWIEDPLWSLWAQVRERGLVEQRRIQSGEPSDPFTQVTARISCISYVRLLAFSQFDQPTFKLTSDVSCCSITTS